MDRQDIKAWIDEKMPELTETLKDICRVRSVAQVKGAACPPYGEGCRQVLHDMLQIGRDAGFRTENFEDYVGRISYPGSKKDNIGIWAHLDVVDEGEGWDYSPYDPVVKDGYLIARGCQDNKSSAVMALYVLKFMKEHDIGLNHTLDLYLGTCEEQGMFDLDYYTEHYPCPTLSLVPDSGFPVCCGERGTFNGELTSMETVSGDLIHAHCDCGAYTIPDRAQAVIRYTPERWAKCEAGCEKIEAVLEGDEIRLTAKGVGSQSANPDRGDSALTILSAFLCEKKLLPKKDLKVFSLIQDINKKHDGSALHNYCEDELSGPVVQVATQLFLPKETRKPVVFITSKYPVSQSDYPFEKRAVQYAAERGFDFKTVKFTRANYFDPEREVVKNLTRCSNEVLGRQDKPFVMSGGTYARKLPNSFAFGTGMRLPKRPESLFRAGHGDYHQPDESIALERIRKALEIYIIGILQIDGLDLTQ